MSQAASYPRYRLVASSSKAMLTAALRAMLADRAEDFLPLPLKLHETVTRYSPRLRDIEAILVWGRKERSLLAMRRAEKRGLPVITLEDGFLRSLDLGITGSPSLSLVVDDLGIYTDSTRPSRLEQLLADDRLYTPELLTRAKTALRLFLDARLSKYNGAPETLPDWLRHEHRPLVLVVDQTFGDASIAGAQADEADFRTMLREAAADHPDALILVKTHPDVLTGRKTGYLTGKIEDANIRLLAEDIHPPALLDRAAAVYTVSSQLGFEAVLRGIPVHCYGLPFYAGWGLTRDRKTSPRRIARRTVEELFAAAMLLYPRYYNPLTEQRAELEDIIPLLAEQRRQQQKLGREAVCIGMSRWKREVIGDFTRTPRGRTHFRDSPDQGMQLAARRKATLIGWASKLEDGFAERCRAAGIPLLQMEDGFIRSVGLGASLTRACSLVLDDQGMYYDPTRPSRLESLLQEGGFPPALLQRAEALRQSILQRNLTKYNLSGAPALPALPAGKRILLVPGQVQDDASVRLGAPETRTNRDLLLAVRAANPEAFLLFKPHPDVVAGYRNGAVPDAGEIADAVVTDIGIASLYPLVDEVHTMTSLSGFEALLRGKKTVCYGLPFYAGWGLTEDRLTCPRRTRRVTLDELVAASLILYPSYVDPVTRQHCTVETIIERLSGDRPEALPKAAIPFRLMQGGAACLRRLGGGRLAA